jgi:hypothetical protein
MQNDTPWLIPDQHNERLTGHRARPAALGPPGRGGAERAVAKRFRNSPGPGARNNWAGAAFPAHGLLTESVTDQYEA